MSLPHRAKCLSENTFQRFVKTYVTKKIPAKMQIKTTIDCVV